MSTLESTPAVSSVSGVVTDGNLRITVNGVESGDIPLPDNPLGDRIEVANCSNPLTISRPTGDYIPITVNVDENNTSISYDISSRNSIKGSIDILAIDGIDNMYFKSPVGYIYTGELTGGEEDSYIIPVPIDLTSIVWNIADNIYKDGDYSSFMTIDVDTGINSGIRPISKDFRVGFNVNGTQFKITEVIPANTMCLYYTSVLPDEVDIKAIYIDNTKIIKTS